MSNQDHLYQAKVQAQAQLERLELEVRAIRAHLTTAEREARKARKAFETARAAYLAAVEEVRS